MFTILSGSRGRVPIPVPFEQSSELSLPEGKQSVIHDSGPERDSNPHFRFYVLLDTVPCLCPSNYPASCRLY